MISLSFILSWQRPQKLRSGEWHRFVTVYFASYISYNASHLCLFCPFLCPLPSPSTPNYVFFTPLLAKNILYSGTLFFVKSLEVYSAVNLCCNVADVNVEA